MSATSEDIECIEITPDMLDSTAAPDDARKRCDIESDFSYFNPLFFFIAALLVIIFIVQVQQGFFSLWEDIDLTNFTYKYSVYRAGGGHLGILTGMFLHGWVGHLIGNLLFLYLFCLISYRVIGFIRSMGVFLLSGLCGGIASYYLGTLPSIGASGAIFGMFGFISMFYIIKRECLSENLEDLSWVMMLFATMEVFAGFSSPYIDNFAHLGGFIWGCLIGYGYFRVFQARLT